MAKLFPTRNDMPANTRHASIEMLNARLADSIDLALAIKQAHWNVKGPDFIAIHEFFDKLRNELDPLVDEMAERVAQLGGTALGTTQAVAKSTKLTAYPTEIHTTTDHLHALIERFGDVGNAVRKNIDEADEAGDADTADLFTGVSRKLDESLWFLESHIQTRA
jgi:starvation-inducible DNA-binding protein